MYSFTRKILLLTVLSCLSNLINADDGSDIDACNYPDIDYLSDRIVDYMATLVPGDMEIPDDNKGTMASRNTLVKGLDSFYRTGPSTYECTETGLRIRVPLKFSKPLDSDFDVSPNWRLKTWIPMNGVINTLEADAVLDVVFVGPPAVHLSELNVNNAREIELGIRGNNFFARAVRKLISLITNEFKGRIKRFLEKNFKEILEERMVKVPLTNLGFN